MAGIKKYDRIELLDKAIELFRMRGYNGTSTADLVEELGVNRKSMYSEFGSKQELFETALKRYGEHHLSNVIAPIESPNANADSIRAAFTGYAEASGGWAKGRGCLLCNTAVERGSLDPAIGQYVDAYFERLNHGFRRALENARLVGDMDQEANLDELAAFFTTSLVGVAASIRGEAKPEQVRAGCNVAIRVLESYRPELTV
ncbi:TetR/AcrR family transcriptional regulator [Candidatus Lucifugimonas marina]|uniref:TetR family transcriptional regulator n=1 Tax=Candidatus Lucifugimonas marina TaxID=3038979 RepID=A0AAJ5ZEK0_9CHLR|nr:TetR family transcriptional regulator [SAR202 cluster bacterium JH702]MDG0870918.1 TetR family transcriptional regulator [SAR202 cluster bacterium JH639]WFG35848.1 TetR family transcriptional regulator [SAR202 cluster bacterium JH545]WFG39793.1 TetR family transcriptional regulator [SAR202 cluster bacterium JH1073]